MAGLTASIVDFLLAVKIHTTAGAAKVKDGGASGVVPLGLIEASKN
jgi:hypothetical protein